MMSVFAVRNKPSFYYAQLIFINPCWAYAHLGWSGPLSGLRVGLIKSEDESLSNGSVLRNHRDPVTYNRFLLLPKRGGGMSLIHIGWLSGERCGRKGGRGSSMSMILGIGGGWFAICLMDGVEKMSPRGSNLMANKVDCFKGCVGAGGSVPNSKELRKCILDGPYVMTEVTDPAQPTTADAPAVLTRVPETFKNITHENHAHFDAEDEAIHMILSGIGDDIYSTVDASEDLDKVSYHKLFDILKQYHNEANEIRAKKLARNANLLALVAAVQYYLKYHNQTLKPHKPNAPLSRQIKSSKSHETTRIKGKGVVKPVTPPFKSASNKDNEEEQAWRDKQIQKSLPLIAKHFKKIYKPNNNNIRTSSNTRNKNRDTSLRNINDNQTGQFMNPSTVTVAGARKTVVNQIREIGQMILMKNWMNKNWKHITCTWQRFKRQHSEQPESINDTYVVEKVDNNVISGLSDMCDNEGKDDQNAEECDIERVESNGIRDRCRSALHHHEIELEKYKSYKDCTIEKDKVERKLKETLSLLAQQEIDTKEDLKTKGHEIFLVKEKNAKREKQSSLEHTRYERLLK
ncbi:hypothetical protein Tco_0848652 [Tanacetum coccineum]